MLSAAEMKGLKRAAISAGALGSNTLVAAVAGKQVVVLGYVLVAAGAVNARFQSATNDLTGLMTFAAAGNDQVAPLSPYGYLATNAGEALNLNLSGAVAVAGYLVYKLV